MKKTKVFFFVCWLTLISGFAFAAAPDYVNDIPEINGSPATQINEDENYNFTPTASDDDTGDTLTFSITNKPSWASFDPITGTLTGTPGNKDVGTANNILIEVTDSAGAKASLPGFSITVLNVNDKPSISIIPDQTIDEDTTTEVLHFTISDVDTPVEQLSIIAKSSDTDLIPNENIVLGSGEKRTIVVSPAPDKHGTCIITITVSDNELTTLQRFDLTVNSIIDPAPVVDFTGTPDLIALGGTSTISWNVEHADVSIDIDQDVGTATKSDSRTVSPSLTTTYTLTAVGEGGTTSAQVTVEVDNVPPTMISFFPKNNATIPSQGGTVTLSESFGDNLAGIKSVTLLDGNNTDITSDAVITPNTSQYVINTPEDKSYNFNVVLEDNVGNSYTHPVAFTVDNSKPITTPSLAAGRYSSAQTVSLTCSEEATIYYSTDGYPPFAGASNTQSGSSSVENIVIKNTTRLQFFAIDNAGNREAAKSVDYFFNDANEALTGLTASYDENLKHVQLSWNQKTDVQRYNIYRCMNMADRTILSDSQTHGYPPAKRLKIANTADNTSDFTDSNLVESAAYYYGVSYIDEDGNESIISDIANVVITAQGQAVSKEDAVARAVAWLQNSHWQPVRH